MTEAEYTELLVEKVAECYHDPLRFVETMYPWGEPGTMLEHNDGPDDWQRELLVSIGREVEANDFDGHTPVMPIRRAVSSGHGIGKGVMAAWLVDWIMSTRPHAQGVVTANSDKQLKTKTWAAIQRWTSLCLTGSWFEINTERMYHRKFPASWFCSSQTCRPENSEAFAGQHAADSTSFYIFDEDSAVPKVIHDVADGGMTDGEPMQFRFGNPTRNSGDFHDCVFGKKKHLWHPMVVDARKVKFSNKQLIAEWIDEYGEESDWVRVRVRGLPPRASDLQFIDPERVHEAQVREVVSFVDEPLVAGVDCSGGGKAWNTVRFRRGMDGRSRRALRVPGEATRKDRSAFLAILADILKDRHPERRVSMMFVDAAYGAPYVERLKQMGFTNVMEVQFGQVENPDSRHCGNMRAYMWKQCKDWLAYGAIPPDDKKLEDDLTTPGHHLNQRDKMFIESKDSMARPLDDADALVLTFAMPVVQTFRRKPPSRPGVFAGRPGGGTRSDTAWMG